MSGSKSDTHESDLELVEAYLNDSLDEKARADFESHLESCDICVETLISAEAYHSLSDSLHASTSGTDLQDVDWQRIENQIVKRITKSTRTKPSMAYALIPLAAAILLFIGWSQLHTTSTTSNLGNGNLDNGSLTSDNLRNENVAAKNQHIVQASTLVGKVSAVFGACSLRDMSSLEDISLEPGQIVRQTNDIVCANGEAHVVFEDASSAFVVHANSRVNLKRTSSQGITLQLEQGGVSNQVKTGQAFAVKVDDLLVEVRGTHFRVNRRGEDVGVRVEEGTVAVIDVDQERLLKAPARWTSADVEVESPRHPRMAFGPLLADLNIPLEFERLRIDGTDAPAHRSKLWVQHNDVTIEALRDGKWHRADIKIAAEGNTISETSFPSLQEKSGRGLNGKDVRTFLRNNPKILKRCIDAALKHNPKLSMGSLTLKLNLSSAGMVRKIGVSNAPTKAMQICLENRLQNTTFPAAERSATVKVKVRIQHD